jgi:two-component system capsular synthesis sensor histidine kinase RcsC
MLLLGGGGVITLVAFLTFAVICVYAVRQFFAREQQQILDDRAHVAWIVREAETSLRRTVNFVELSWPTLPKADIAVYQAFVRNGNWLVVPRPTMPSGVIFAAAREALDDPALVRRYLALAQQFAISNASAAMSGNVDADGYIYTPHQELIVIPATTLALEAHQNVGELIELLKIDFPKLLPRGRQSSGGLQNPLYWVPAFTDPLSGKVRVRLSARAFSDGKPFAVIVMEYDPQALLSTLVDRDGEHAYEIAESDGRIIASLGSDADKHRVAAAGAREPRRLTFFGGKAEYDGGHFLLKETIAETGWTLLYAFSWREVVAGVAAQVGTAAVATVVILGVVWVLLLMFRRQVFAPVLADSERVFESEDLSRTLIHTVPVGLALVSRESGEWLLNSPPMQQMESRIAGETRALANALVSRYAEFERELPRGEPGRVLHQDFTFSAHDGSRIELAVSASHARFNGIDVLVAAFIDVTENRRLQRELGEAKLAADSANQAKSAFLAAMSHEIRTPLNAILGNLELLANSPLSSAQRDRLATVRAASDGLLSVISDILDFSKIEAGEMTLEYIEFRVLEVIEHVLEIFKPLARSRGIGLYARLDLASAQTMYGDPTRVGQILNNLLGNAIKFTEHGAVTLIAGIEGGEVRELCFAVVDTGIGIAPAHREQLFRAFSQLDLSINRRFGGTGLGLTLCERIVRAMHGRIDVSSELHVGSCFTVHLPLGADIGKRAEARMLDGQRVLFLSPAREWCDFVVPHLERWGASVTQYRHPVAITEGELEVAAVLVIWGSRDQWRPDDENRLVEEAACVIDGHPDGPAQAIRTGKIVSVSCLSLTGLEASVRATLLGEPLSSLPDSENSWMRADTALRTHGLKVLVAEDNAANRMLLCEQLASLGCQVKAASSGKQALELLDDDWDVLLTDLNMPGMSGYQLAEAVRALRPALPIMAITAHATKDERKRCAAAGMTHVMIKPLSLQQLNDAVSAIATAKGVKLSTSSNADEAKFRGHAMPPELREIFVKATEESLEAIDAAQMARDSNAIAAQLHSIRGALAVFGHAELASDCARVEEEIRRDGTADLPAGLDTLKAALRDMLGKEA